MLTHLWPLSFSDAWFNELTKRLPLVDIYRLAPGQRADLDVLNRVGFLHTSEWSPGASEVPNLRCVQLDTSGVDHVRQTSLRNSDVAMSTLRGTAPVPMAEYALMSILELALRMLLIDQIRGEMRWPSNAERRETSAPLQLAGSIVSIIGYGRIGREISRLCCSFGMNVLGLRRGADAGPAIHEFDAGRPGSDEDRAEIFPMSTLHDGLQHSEMLVVLLPLTELTRGIVGPRELDALPPGAVVINIARGGIVDETALIERLRAGRIDGVALDVFDDDPLPADSPWWSQPPALVTPHVAELSPKYHAQALDLVEENLTRLADGRSLMKEVNRVSGY